METQKRCENSFRKDDIENRHNQHLYHCFLNLLKYAL